MGKKMLASTKSSNTILISTEKCNENSLQVRAVEALAVPYHGQSFGHGAIKLGA